MHSGAFGFEKPRWSDSGLQHVPNMLRRSCDGALKRPKAITPSNMIRRNLGIRSFEGRFSHGPFSAFSLESQEILHVSETGFGPFLPRL